MLAVDYLRRYVEEAQEFIDINDKMLKTMSDCLAIGETESFARCAYLTQITLKSLTEKAILAAKVLEDAKPEDKTEEFADLARRLEIIKLGVKVADRLNEKLCEASECDLVDFHVLAEQTNDAVMNDMPE